MRLRRRKDVAQRAGLFPGFVDFAEIGTGSLSTVYRAREVDTGRLVALKLLNLRDVSPRALESFQRESVALGALSAHPNIVTLYRTYQLPDGRPVLVLQLCTGSIADRLSVGRLSAPEVVSIGIKIAGALQTAHQAGILHRDVRPHNILVTEFGEPALADFGVAMLQSSSQTTAGLFDFTTLHAAPELLEGGLTSPATDVYELASTLYQLLCGQSAFRANEGESPASVILRILRDPVRPITASDVPVQLSDLLIAAMSKDQTRRPGSATEFASQLMTVEAHQGWQRTTFLAPGAPPTVAAPYTLAALYSPAQPVLALAEAPINGLALPSRGAIDPPTWLPAPRVPLPRPPFLRLQAALDQMRREQTAPTPDWMLSTARVGAIPPSSLPRP